MDYLSAYLVSQKKIAPVAQWIERQPPELEVAGSNPAGRTSNKFADLGPTLKLAFFILELTVGLTGCWHKTPYNLPYNTLPFLSSHPHS